jgi:transposase
MRRGRPTPPLKLTEEQREQLKQWARRRTTARALAHRAEIILLSAEDVSDMAIAQRLRTTRVTVGRWRRRFLRHGVDGLLGRTAAGVLHAGSVIRRWGSGSSR